MIQKLLLLLFVTLGLSFKTTQNQTTAAHVEAAQNFEGVVKYKFLMEDVSSLTDEQIEAQIKKGEPMFGRHIVYYIKEPKMKSVMDGNFMKLTSYYDETDSMYVHSPDLNEFSKVSTYDDWSYTYDSVIPTKNAKVINGTSCDLLTFKSEKYEWKYYYNDQLKVNPDNFKHYQSCFWNKAIEMCNALPIRFEGKIPGAYIYMEAEDISSQPVDDSEFTLPKM